MNGSDKAVGQTQMEEEINSLRNCVSEQIEIISRLTENLSPISRDEPPSDKESSELVTLVHRATQIRSIRMDIEENNERLQFIISRLEV